MIERDVYGGSWSTFNLGDLAAGLPVFARFTHTWATASYTAGGEDVVVPDLPNLQTVIVEPKNGYTQQFDAGKLKAYSAPGTEATGTNMVTAVGTVHCLAIGQRPFEVPAIVFAGSRFLLKLELEVAADVAESGSRYWSIEAQVVRGVSGEVYEIGSPLSTESLGLSAGQRYALFSAEVASGAETLRDGDQLRLYMRATGNPQALVQVRLHARTRWRT